MLTWSRLIGRCWSFSGWLGSQHRLGATGPSWRQRKCRVQAGVGCAQLETVRSPVHPRKDRRSRTGFLEVDEEDHDTRNLQRIRIPRGEMVDC